MTFDGVLVDPAGDYNCGRCHERIHQPRGMLTIAVRKGKGYVYFCDLKCAANYDKYGPIPFDGSSSKDQK